jgi:hypothetical protein
MFIQLLFYNWTAQSTQFFKLIFYLNVINTVINNPNSITVYNNDTILSPPAPLLSSQREEFLNKCMFLD